MEAKRAGVPPLLGRSGQTPVGPWIWRILHHSTAGALMLVKIEVRFGRAAEYDVDVASHVLRGSNALKFALLHHAFVLLALILDAVLVLAVAAVWKLAHHLIWTTGGVPVRKTGA